MQICCTLNFERRFLVKRRSLSASLCGKFFWTSLLADKERLLGKALGLLYNAFFWYFNFKPDSHTHRMIRCSKWDRVYNAAINCYCVHITEFKSSFCKIQWQLDFPGGMNDHWNCNFWYVCVVMGGGGGRGCKPKNTPWGEWIVPWTTLDHWEQWTSLTQDKGIFGMPPKQIPFVLCFTLLFQHNTYIKHELVSWNPAFSFSWEPQNSVGWSLVYAT